MFQPYLSPSGRQLLQKYKSKNTEGLSLWKLLTYDWKRNHIYIRTYIFIYTQSHMYDIKQ